MIMIKRKGSLSFISVGEDSHLQRWEKNKLVSVGVQSPTEINAPRGCAGIRYGILPAKADANPAHKTREQVLKCGENLYRKRRVHTEDMHIEDMHTEDMHTEDMHTEDMHTEDMHTEDMHTEDMHIEDMHTEDMHTEDMHIDDMHMKNIRCVSKYQLRSTVILKILVISLCMFLGLGLTSCGNQEDTPALYEYDVCFLNKDTTKVISQQHKSRYENTEAHTQELIRELLYVLSNVAEKPEYVPPISGNVCVASYVLEEEQLTLDFNELYYKQDKIQEILGRAAIVRTLSQLAGVRNITFTVLGVPLTDTAGLPVGTMTADTFIDNAGTEINAYEQAKLHLYFANEAGDRLVMEERKVMYNSNISMEKLVMDELIKGPAQSEEEDESTSGKERIPELEQKVFPTINPETVVQGVTVKDGVCYVNLSENFLTQIYNVSSEVTIYSIANSLAELPNVNKVQISINGESNLMFRESMNLTTIFERNLDIMEETYNRD